MKLNFSKYLLYFKKYELLLSSAVSLVFLVLVIVFFLIPKFGQVQEISSESKRLLTQKSALIKKSRTLSSINQDRYKKTYSHLTKIIPDRKDYVSLFNTLDTLEGKHDIVLLKADFELGVVSTQSGKLEKGEGTQAFVIPTTIELIGEIDRLKGFLSSLGDLTGRLMSVKEVKWSYGEEDTVRVIVYGNAYFYPVSQSLGSVDSPLPEISQSQSDIIDQVIAKAPLEEEKIDYSEVVVGKTNLFQ